MAKVSAASGTQNFGAVHPKTVIDPGDDIFFRHRLEETGLTKVEQADAKEPSGLAGKRSDTDPGGRKGSFP